MYRNLLDQYLPVGHEVEVVTLYENLCVELFSSLILPVQIGLQTRPQKRGIFPL